MAIVDFEQDPSAPYGTGNFRDDAGRVMYLYDPETASQFAKTMKGAPVRGGADGRVARNDPLPADTFDQLRGTAPPEHPDGTPVADIPAPTPGAEAQPAATPASAPATAAAGAPAAVPQGGAGAALVQTLGSVQAEAAGAQQPPAAPATPGQPPAAPAGSGAGANLVAALDSARPDPISARSQPTTTPEPSAYSPGSLPLGKTGEADSVTVKQGMPLDKALEEVADREAIGEAGDSLIRNEYERQGRANEWLFARQRNAARDEYGRNVSRVFERSAERRAAEEKVTRLQEALKRNDESLDPDRYMRNMSTGSFVATTILAALNGAFGAMIGQQRNGVIDALDQAIERDIQRQKEEIASGRIRMQNDINRFMQEGHDAKEAEMLARDALIGNMNAFLDLEAKRVSALPEARAQAALLIQPRLEQRAKDRAETLRLANDEVTRSYQREREHSNPVIGPQDMLAMLNFGERKKEVENTDYYERMLGRPVSADQAKVLEQDKQEFAAKSGQNRETEKRILDLGTMMGLRVDKRGELVGDADPGVRPFGTEQLSDKARDVTRAYTLLKESRTHSAPREPAAALEKEFGTAIERPFNDSDIPGQLNALLRIVRRNEDNLRKGYGEAARLYDVEERYKDQARRSPPAPARGGPAPARGPAPAPAAPPAAAPAAAPPARKPNKAPGGLRFE